MMNDEKDDRNVSPKSEKVVHDEEEKSNNGSSINAELEEELCELWDMTMDSVSENINRSFNAMHSQYCDLIQYINSN